MTDIFISYAHDDQAFVRRMVPALEAEGFSVWWDHTIPPGKSWDTFIAKGITDARCCVVVWSRNSIESDWVKEEATLAKGKLLPVTIDRAEPPVGFRRIQAANLTGWNGDRNDPHWQLLLQEVRSHTSREANAAPSSPAQWSRPKPKTLPWAAIAVVLAVIGVTAGAFLLNQTPEQSALPETRANVADGASAANAELENLRRERDEALQRVESERIERERAEALAEQRDAQNRRLEQREADRQAAEQRVGDVVGSWDVQAWGATGIWIFETDGTYRIGHTGGNGLNEDGQWTLTGNQLVLTSTGRSRYSITLRGNSGSGNGESASGANTPVSITRRL